MTFNLQIILKKKPILDYLDRRGIQPAKRMSGGKYAFYCPFPDHQDTKSPSFIVWTNAEYENFYCFGCQRGSTIVHLYSHMNGCSFRESLRILSDGLDISIEENVKFSLNKVLSDLEKSDVQFSKKDFGQKMLSISSLCYSYLDGVDLDRHECSIMELFWSEVDQEILQFDFDGIEETLRYLPEILSQRRLLFEKSKDEKLEYIVG